MNIDALTLVSNGQQITADAVSTSSYDTGNVTPKVAVGSGEEVGFAVVVTAAGTTSGSAIISAIESTAADLGSAVVKLNARALVTAQLAVGQAHFIPIPPKTNAARYIGLDYDITGTVDFTVKSWLTTASMFQAYTTYAKGYTVS